MGRLDQLQGSLRRMYAAGRDSLRAARERAGDPNGEARELSVAGEPAREEAPVAGVAASGEGGDTDAPAPRLAVPQPVSAPQPGLPSIDDAVPRGLRIAAAWAWRLIVIGVVVYALLWLAGQYMLMVAPLMISLLLAGLLMPAQRALLKVGINRSIGALAVVVGGLAVLGGTLALVVNSFVTGLDDMVQQVERGVLDFQEWIQGPPLNLSEADLQDLFQDLEGWTQDNADALTGGALAFATGTLQFFTGAVLVLVVTFFFLRDGRRIWDFLVNLLPAAARPSVWYAGDGAWRSLSGYVRATVLVALVDAIGIGVGLQILSVTMSFPPGLVLPSAALVFLGGFVPIVGAFVSGTVAVVVGLATGETWPERLAQALIVLGIVLLVQQLEGNVLQPFIVSKMVRLHPLAVILAVLAGILLAGIIGALIAVPVVAVLNTASRRLHAYHYRRRLPPVAGGISPAPTSD